MKDLTGFPDEEKLEHLNWQNTKVESASMDELRNIIHGELKSSNVFVRSTLWAAEAFSWSDKQTLAQLVVVLGRENNRLQDELLKREYSKAYPEPVVVMDEAKARELLAEFLDGDKLVHPHVAHAEQSDFVELNWSFNAEQLQALSWWLRNKQ